MSARPTASLALALALALVLAAAGPAAAVEGSGLEDAGVTVRRGAALPMGAGFTDESGTRLTLGQALAGRPALLVFVDFRCTHVCGPALDIAAAGLAQAGLLPGRDLSLVAVGLRPSEPLSELRAFQASRPSSTRAALGRAELLTGDRAAIARASAAAGFRYGYDRVQDQFVHPVAAYAVSPGGRVFEVLSEVALTGPALRAALAEAQREPAAPERAAVLQWVGGLCHGLAAAGGRLTRQVSAGLKIVGILTLLAMALGVGRLARRRAAA